MKTHATLFLAWQDPFSRSWFPIGRLTFDGDFYQFAYTQGVLEAQQQCGSYPASFPCLNEVYTSTYLFPVFANRVMPKNRPDYPTYIQWLNLTDPEYNPIAMLSRSGGQRETDSLTVFPCPEPDTSGLYRLHFFLHGLRHLPPCAIERINRLSPGEELWVAHFFQNSYDSKALTLNTLDHYIVGYCPQYLNSELFELLTLNPSFVNLRVERVNQPPTPLQFRLLCNLTARSTHNFRPFSSPQYQPLIYDVAA